MLSYIPKVKIYGCMRSGTNFFEFLFFNYFNMKPFVNEHGWKHGDIKHNLNCYNIIIFKDIHSWLVSFFDYVNINQVHDLQNFFPFHESKNFSDFIRKPIFHRMINHDFDAPNPIIHWVHQNKSWYNSDKEKKIFINYERLLFDTKSQLEKLRDIIGITKQQNDIVFPSGKLGYYGYKHKQKSKSLNFNKVSYYKNKEYMKFFSKSDLDFVNKYFDYDLYEKIMAQCL